MTRFSFTASVLLLLLTIGVASAQPPQGTFTFTPLKNTYTNGSGPTITLNSAVAAKLKIVVYRKKVFPEFPVGGAKKIHEWTTNGSNNLNHFGTDSDGIPGRDYWAVGYKEVVHADGSIEWVEIARSHKYQFVEPGGNGGGGGEPVDPVDP